MVNNNYYKNTQKIESSMHPWFITGYSDGKSSFSIRLRSNLSNVFGFKESLVYSIGAEINNGN
jgi:hypothetical protein